MSIYFESISRQLPLFIIPVFFFGVLAWPSDNPSFTAVLTNFTPLILIIAAAFFVYWRKRRPAVVINGNVVEVQSSAGKVRTVDNPEKYTLVVGSDFIALRHPGQRDVIINQRRFSRSDWKAIYAEVSALPFGEVEA